MKKGFTILELLICIIILSILFAILFPIFIVVKKNAYQTVTMSSLRDLGHSWKMYCSDYDDALMRASYSGDHWWSILLTNNQILKLSDSSLKYYKWNNLYKYAGYAYNPYFSLNDKKGKPLQLNLSSINDPSNTVSFSQSGGLFLVNNSYELFPVSTLSVPSSGFPTFHARFNGYGIVLWSDTHVSIMKAKFYSKNKIYEKYNLGHIDRDNNSFTNELFDLD